MIGIPCYRKVRAQSEPHSLTLLTVTFKAISTICPLAVGPKSSWNLLFDHTAEKGS